MNNKQMIRRIFIGARQKSLYLPIPGGRGVQQPVYYQQPMQPMQPVYNQQVAFRPGLGQCVPGTQFVAFTNSQGQSSQMGHQTCLPVHFQDRG